MAPCYLCCSLALVTSRVAPGIRVKFEAGRPGVGEGGVCKLMGRCFFDCLFWGDVKRNSSKEEERWKNEKEEERQ